MNRKYIYGITAIAALGGFLFGYDTAVIAGAIGSIREKFDLSPVMEGWAASAAIWGCVIGVLFAGVLSDRFGRKKVLIVTALLFATSAILSALPNNLIQFSLARLIGGFGVGAASMISPMYISEMAPSNIRGRLVTFYQLAIVLGINLVYFVNLQIAGSGDELWNIDTGWRYMLASEVIPAVLFLIALIFVPESPRWLIANDHESKARDILTKINGPAQAQEIVSEVQDSLQEEQGTLRELFATGYRIAIIIGVVLAIFSQITGINAIIYYAPEIFKSVGFGTESALFQTVIIGVVNVLFTFVAIWLIDQAGRKTLLLYGVSGMIICLFGMGISFYLDLSSGPILLIFILGYIASFACSLGPIPWVIISEIFPTKTRGLAMSLCIVMLWIGVILITQFFPILLNSVGGAYTFWIFMVNAIILLLFVWRMVPETRQKTLEEIERSWN